MPPRPGLIGARARHFFCAIRLYGKFHPFVTIVSISIDVIHKHTDAILVQLHTGVSVDCVIYLFKSGVNILGRTSSKVKDRYNEKAYDRHTVRFKKGEKARIQAHAASQGKSLNGYIVDLIAQDMQGVPQDGEDTPQVEKAPPP